jgi:hypothetical protein
VETETKRGQGFLKHNLLMLNGSVARLGHRGVRQEKGERGEKREKDHAKGNGTKTPQKVLASRGGLLWLFISGRVLCRYSRG